MAGARHVDLWHDVSQTFSCHLMSPEIHSQMTYVKSSALIKPPEGFFHRHIQQIPPSLRLAVEKVKVIHRQLTSAKPWSAPACSARRNRWHWGRGCRRRRRRRTFHRSRRTRPMCGGCGLWAPFRSGTADSSDWPGESRRDVLKVQAKHWLNLRWLRKIQSWFWLYKNGVGHSPAIYLNSCFFQLPHLPLCR